MLRTNTNAAQSQPQSFFGRIGRVLRETFNPPAAPTREKAGPDSFVRGTPLSVAASRRLAAQNSGRSADGTRGTSEHAPSRDAQLVAYLNHISVTGDPST